jgi:hypothetical protein
MHPNEMKHSALVAAAKAEQDGFVETAKAFLLLADVCAGDARELGKQTGRGRPNTDRSAPSGRVMLSLVSH